MSKLPLPKSKGVPKSGGIPIPSGGFQASGSRTPREQPCAGKKGKAAGAAAAALQAPVASTSTAATPTPVPSTSTAGGKSTTAPKTGKKQQQPQQPLEKIDFLLPALSVFKKRPEDKKYLEKMKKEMLRRIAPQGEDIKKIKEIMRGMKGQDISVHEFVGLVAPYTGDNGTVLRSVLARELANFRKMARRIYDTMTKDVGDVLTNEHIQLTESSREKHAQYSDKMMRAIDEIFEYCPSFDFEKYYTDPEYLDRMFPLAKQPVLSEDEQQEQLRQEAYHRLMWLRSEGDRLNEENARLQNRLHELKGRQRQEMMRATQIEQEHEQKREILETTQEDLQNQLENMNRMVERTMVEEEKMINEDVYIEPTEQMKTREPRKTPKMKVKRPEGWALKTAAEIEEKTTSEALVAEASKVSMASTKSSTKVTGTKKKIKKKIKIKKRPQETSPFHFSPIKTPPRGQPQKQASPFHYSPPKTPPQYRQRQQQASPFHYSPPKTPAEYRQRQQTSPQGAAALSPTRVETTRLQSSSTVVEEAPTYRGRRTYAPRDTWGGFG